MYTDEIDGEYEDARSPDPIAIARRVRRRSLMRAVERASGACERTTRGRRSFVVGSSAVTTRAVVTRGAIVRTRTDDLETHRVRAFFVRLAGASRVCAWRGSSVKKSVGMRSVSARASATVGKVRCEGDDADADAGGGQSGDARGRRTRED